MSQLYYYLCIIYYSGISNQTDDLIFIYNAPFALLYGILRCQLFSQAIRYVQSLTKY